MTSFSSLWLKTKIGISVSWNDRGAPEKSKLHVRFSIAKNLLKMYGSEMAHLCMNSNWGGGNAGVLQTMVII
jgi:hypothetical protein